MSVSRTGSWRMLLRQGIGDAVQLRLMSKKGRCGEPVRAALRVTIAHDQPGMLKHPEMPGRNGGRHVERLCKFRYRYRCLSSGAPRKDCPWVGSASAAKVELRRSVLARA
uniref:hypothetical protein n=1 Tax=Caballeronia sp. LjRoot34 TaxID=3342325 RepID=UPI003F5023B5